MLELLILCDEKQIKGIFKMVGEKARVLAEHGRTDILEKLKNHEVGYHTDFHSVHPTVSEYLERKGFREGAEQFHDNEFNGFQDVASITGMPIKCYGQPGFSWAPQAFPALLGWGIPVYLDTGRQITLHAKPYWYGGMLNFMDLPGLMRMELMEGGLEEAKRQFDDIYEKLSAQSIGFVSIVYHPNEFSTTEFWDLINFGEGKNTPRNEWRPAPLRPFGMMERYIRMLGQFIDYTLSKENVEYITSAQTLELEKSRKDELAPEHVRTLAANTGKDLYFQLFSGYSLSVSDLHSIFVSYLLGKPLVPELIYGPETAAESDIVTAVKVADLKAAISVPYPKVRGSYHLPDHFHIGEAKINPVDVTCTLAKVIREGLKDEDEVTVVRGSLRTQIHANEDDFWGNGWEIFPRDFRVPNIVRMSKLQTWTLKPAIF
ncbi:hypothetical protein [Paenibacillus montanisoli]|uniref:hypothetical protein n=1 Tax=Paenibacillus montanisoli TaxID=2081970 RepID=UPI001057DFFB|nr:hypothetical protein [Paenibacillus montanisoli]